MNFTTFSIISILLTISNACFGFRVECELSEEQLFRTGLKTCTVKEVEVPEESDIRQLDFDLKGESASNIKRFVLYSKESNLGFNSIPTEVFIIFPNLESLEIRSNINLISSNDFTFAKNLRKLDLRNNKIDKIEPNTFNDLNQLERLQLLGNKLTVVRQGTFTELSSLQYLSLSTNSITMIEDGALDLSNLVELSLSYNKLKNLSDNIFCKLPKLKVLWMLSSEITHLGRSLYCLQNLEKAFLDGNKFESFDFTEIAKLPHLIKLTLINTDISLHPGKDTKAGPNPVENTSLKTLDLSYNELSDPQDLKHLSVFKGLQKLTLNGNSYINLDLGSTKLKDIFPNLKYLDLIWTDISKEEIEKIHIESGTI